MKSALYIGRVRHRRFTPVDNQFCYRLFMLYLDLDELPRLFRKSWLWSAQRPALAWFRRSDHHGAPADLATATRDLVEQQTGHRPRGSIRLLTHLRYFGYCFNPVSFYYCFDETDSHVEAVVAEITNTPWGERHCYALRAGDERRIQRFGLAKVFHVSPFMPMDIHYDWRFSQPAEHLFVHMENWRDGERVFDATLALKRVPISSRTLATALAAHPLMTVRVVALIHWQALRLWLKRAPFYPHPGRRGPATKAVRAT